MSEQPKATQKGMTQSRMVSIPDGGQYLDSVQLQQLEQSFRAWSKKSSRADINFSRHRILIVFLLIRHTGAKLNEVLSLDFFKDIDFEGRVICFKNEWGNEKNNQRKVYISSLLSSEIRNFLSTPSYLTALLKNQLRIDPGFVRLKFYARAEDCGFSKHLGGPEMIRKSRAVELMQGNMPMPAVQKMLGHSNPNLTSSYVSFSEGDIQEVIKLFIEKEASRKTSARNSFFGKIRNLHRGSIQTMITLTTLTGYHVSAVITNNSLDRLALKKGRLVTAEIKAPWISIQKGNREISSSADNKFKGIIEEINEGKVTTEYIVRISDGTELCAVVSTESARNLALAPNDAVWALFNCFAVVLNVD